MPTENAVIDSTFNLAQLSFRAINELSLIDFDILSRSINVGEEVTVSVQVGEERELAIILIRQKNSAGDEELFYRLGDNDRPLPIQGGAQVIDKNALSDFAHGQSDEITISCVKASGEIVIEFIVGYEAIGAERGPVLRLAAATVDEAQLNVAAAKALQSETKAIADSETKNVTKAKRSADEKKRKATEAKKELEDAAPQQKDQAKEKLEQAAESARAATEELEEAEKIAADSKKDAEKAKEEFDRAQAILAAANETLRKARG